MKNINTKCRRIEGEVDNTEEQTKILTEASINIKDKYFKDVGMDDRRNVVTHGRKKEIK